MRKTVAVALLAAVLAMAGCSSTAGKSEQQVKKVSKEEAVQLITEAQSLIGQGNLTQAKDKVEVAVASNPNDAKTQFMAGIVAFNDKKYDEAIEAYNKVIKLDPKYVEAYNNLGNVYRDQKKYDEAAKWYEQSIKVDPKFAFGYTNYALMRIGEGKATEAVAVLEKGTIADPNNLDMKFLLAQAYNEAGQKDKAKATAEAVLRANPDLKAAQDLLKQLGQ